MNQFWKKEEGVTYNEEKRRMASSRAVLYYLVACYVIYMGVCLLKNQFAGDDSMSLPVAVLFAVLLFAGGILVAWHAAKRMKQEFDQSVIKDTAQEETLEEKK